MNEQDQQAQHRGRSYRARAYGDAPDELELSALDKARDVFGDKVRLEIVRDYTVFDVKESSGPEVRASGKKLWTEIRVLVHD